MSGKGSMKLSKVFEEKPVQGGLRGDPHLWSALDAWFLDHEAPETVETFSDMLEVAFEEITGTPLWSRAKQIYIEVFNTGGMSGGYVSLEFWRENGIPLLIGNYQRIIRDSINAPNPRLKRPGNALGET